ncbi:MAG TPA: DUF1232 domain-containing protein, partial [Acidisoma sp.]|nr:DUF1232 domain-containing protein [Acidisoma sp.]
RARLELAVLCRGGLLTFRCPLSKLALLIGIGYWFSPLDFIPNRLPYIGYLDQIGFVVAGVLLARLLIPVALSAAIKSRRPPPALLRPFTVVFCHCPKTAGTSLFRALSDRLGYRASYLMRRQRPDLAHLQRRGFALVSGHAPFGHYRDAGAINAETRFITFFREPRAVLLSRFAHVLRHRNSFRGARQFFEVDLARRSIGMTSPEALHLFLEHHRIFDASDADNPQTRFAANHFCGPLEESHFEAAKASFAAMDLVGCTERFEDSLQLLASRLGWTSLSYHRLNVSEQRQRVSADAGINAALDQHLGFDHRLIAWAGARFDQEYAAMIADCAAHGRAPPNIQCLEAEPPYRALRHRISAACTLLLDDWLWWLGAKGAALRQRLPAPRSPGGSLTPLARADGPDHS